MFVSQIQDITKMLIDNLKLCDISDDELAYRKAVLEDAQKLPGSEINCVSDRYYNLAHEIKSFLFLRDFGSVKIAEDSKHSSGCDCILDDKYQIECVCCSAGEKSAGLHELCVENVLVDYAKKEKILHCRLTSVIKAKHDFYVKNIKNGSIDSDKPYIIFIGLGSLAYEMFSGEKGIEYTSILFGKGDLLFSRDTETGSLISSGYSHNAYLINHNNAKINCNIFCSEEYRSISGIIISAADINEPYTYENTWLFLNPMANIKIPRTLFSSIVCWDRYSDSVYGPYKDDAKIASQQ